MSLSEQLSPLIEVDMTIKTEGENEPQIKVELKRDRNVAFGLTNYQITETKSEDWSLDSDTNSRTCPIRSSRPTASCRSRC